MIMSPNPDYHRLKNSPCSQHLRNHTYIAGKQLPSSLTLSRIIVCLIFELRTDFFAVTICFHQHGAAASNPDVSHRLVRHDPRGHRQPHGDPLIALHIFLHVIPSHLSPTETNLRAGLRDRQLQES